MTDFIGRSSRRPGGQFAGHVSTPGDHFKGTEMSASISNAAVRTLSDLPSPRGLPLLGNALQFDLPRLHLVLEKWAEEFGSVFTISLGPKQIFVCSDADLLQTALRERPDRYRRFHASSRSLKR